MMLCLVTATSIYENRPGRGVSRKETTLFPVSYSPFFASLRERFIVLPQKYYPV